MLEPSQPKLYNPRHPERTLLYQTVAEHYETWLELASAGQFDWQGDHHSPRPFVRQAFEKYLEFGFFAHGFARARCEDCGHDFLVAFSCKGRGVCPSCNARRMAETAAHLSDHVFPRLPVRQWVLPHHAGRRDLVGHVGLVRELRRQIDPRCRFHVSQRDDLQSVARSGLAAANCG